MGEDFLKKKPDNDTGGPEELMMFYPGKAGEGDGVCRIRIKDDGSADLSDVPDYLRQNWEAFGARLPSMTGVKDSSVMPEDGLKFMEAIKSRARAGSGVWFAASGKKPKDI